MNRNVMKVSQVNQYIKGLIDHDYILNNAMIEGEISNYKLHSSGHAYFSLKDEKSAISCVLFRGNRQHIALDLMNGMKVVVKGNVSVYERDGRYQIYVRDVSDAGLGLLYQKYELLKKECEAKGYFSESVKKPIPKYPLKVGVVTSPTGAAIQDMINVQKRRNPYCQLILFPALVQGENAYKTVVEGIRYFNTYEPVDVMIIGRGGGSIEDLWAFNEKAVVEAIYQSDIPIISAVGHETDYTLSDFASDLRAPTPSSGAELAVFDYGNLEMLLDSKSQSMSSIIMYQLEQVKNQLSNLSIKAVHLAPKQRIKDSRQRLKELEKMLQHTMDNILKVSFSDLALLESKLKGLNPKAKLTGGYGYVHKDGKPVQSVLDLSINSQVKITLNDGIIEADITKIDKSEGE